jgi:hypothetical protein
MIVNMHIKKYIVFSLPCPQPTVEELTAEPYATLVKNAATLQVLHNPGVFPQIEKEFNINPETLPKTLGAKEKLNDQLRIQNDVLVAGLYQVTPDEMDYILGTLPFLIKRILITENC